MMSLETRSTSALFKRAEQLKRWEESQTNRESVITHKDRQKKIQFSDSCIFLAACAAGDKEEVKQLIEKGADIDTANVDGLTALHQACIDDNLDMVEFLVEHGADINRGDNEGWTPLHATVSSGFISIAKFLLDHGAHVDAVNNDGELPIDISEVDEMDELLQRELNAKGIDCDQARVREEQIMIEHAKQWLNSGTVNDDPHPKTGARALHVAAAKGYIKVMSLLLKANADVNSQDFDGWTPLHAAAHWGQKEACEILTEGLCDMEKRNYVGQTAYDVADTEVLQLLEELKKKQANILKDRGDSDAGANKRQNAVLKRRLPSTDKSNVISKDPPTERQSTADRAAQDEGPRVGMKERRIMTHDSSKEKETSEESAVEKKNKVNRDDAPLVSNTTSETHTKDSTRQVPTSPPKTPVENNDDSNIPLWRRSGSLRSRGAAINNREETTARPTRLHSEKEEGSRSSRNMEDVVLRRAHSFENDSKREKEKSGEVEATTPPSPSKVTSTPPLPPGSLVRSPASTPSASSSAPTSPTTPVTPTSPGGSKLSPGNIFKNLFKSFIPPVRDEESETQRKAHAKRVRETRRSTQGVTLEELKTAEQLVKKQQLQNQTAPNDGEGSLPVTSTTSTTTTTTSKAITTTTTLTSTCPPTTTNSGTDRGEDDASTAAMERRPSWRLRLDENNRSKFSLEDTRHRSSQEPSVSATITTANSTVSRRPNTGVANRNSVGDTSATDEVADTTVTLSLRRPTSRPISDDRKGSPTENEGDQDANAAQNFSNAMATQAAIQRRRRPKRRSTGVVQLDMDELDPERRDEETNDTLEPDNLADRSYRSSRLSSAASSVGDGSAASSRAETPASNKGSRASSVVSENGEIDYKKLYEECLSENERLRERLKDTDSDLAEARAQVERAKQNEKREQRSFERKLSEMEEELKQLQKLKAENEKLRSENRALTRVVSKLTNSNAPSSSSSDTTK